MIDIWYYLKELTLNGFIDEDAMFVIYSECHLMSYMSYALPFRRKWHVSIELFQSTIWGIYNGLHIWGGVYRTNLLRSFIFPFFHYCQNIEYLICNSHLYVTGVPAAALKVSIMDKLTIGISLTCIQNWKPDFYKPEILVSFKCTTF